MINTATEEVELAETSSVLVEQLASAISQTAPRYSFFRYEHTHDGQQQTPTIFVYTCPASSKPKERMLYSCMKRNMISLAEGAGLTLDKKVRR